MRLSFYRKETSVGILIVAVCGLWAAVGTGRSAVGQVAPTPLTRPSALRATSPMTLQYEGQAIGIMEATGLDSETEVIEARQGNDNLVVKLPGRHRTSRVTVRYSALRGDPLLAWRQAVVEGKLTTMKKTVAIVVTDRAGKESMRFTLRNAWPSRYAYSTLTALIVPDEITAIVAVTLEHSGIEFPK